MSSSHGWARGERRHGRCLSSQPGVTKSLKCGKKTIAPPSAAADTAAAGDSRRAPRPSRARRRTWNVAHGRSQRRNGARRQQRVFRVHRIEADADQPEVVERIAVEHAGPGPGLENDPLEVVGRRDQNALLSTARAKASFDSRPCNGPRARDVTMESLTPGRQRKSPSPLAAAAMRRQTVLTSGGVGFLLYDCSCTYACWTRSSAASGWSWASAAMRHAPTDAPTSSTGHSSGNHPCCSSRRSRGSSASPLGPPAAAGTHPMSPEPVHGRADGAGPAGRHALRMGGNVRSSGLRC